jgi:hypothetical protein
MENTNTKRLRLAHEFQAQARERDIALWKIGNCSVCGVAICYVFDGDAAFLDRSCDCTNLGKPEHRTWSDVANHYNRQTHQHVIAEMDRFWGFECRQFMPATSGHIPENVIPAPIWALMYIGRMASLCQHKRSLRVLMADDFWFDDLGDGADGCCLQLDDGTDIILIRMRARPNKHWYAVLAHEFAHVLHAIFDRHAVAHMDTDAYMAYRDISETFAPLLGGLVQAALGTEEPSP